MHKNDSISNLFPKRIPKIVLQSSFRKLPRQNSCRKLFPKITYFKVSSKTVIFRNIIQRCCSKLLCRNYSCSPKLLLPKVVSQSCSQSCAPKRLPTTPSQSTAAKWYPKAAILQIYSPKRFPSKVVPENCSAKLLRKDVP